METHFSKKQLTNPELSEANDILRTCVHCGLCNATCPTYVLLGDERDGPRGRIYQIKDMLESGQKPSDEMRLHIDRCLSCQSCMTACPSGVDYMHLADLARSRIEQSASRPWGERLARRLIRVLLPYPTRFRTAILGAALAKPLRRLLQIAGLKELAAMIGMAPANAAKLSAYTGRRLITPTNPRARVVLMSGCAQRVLRPETNDATIRLLTAAGVEVVQADHEGCCGALVQHMGHEDEARNFARRNIVAWEKAIASAPLDAILITTSGCGTTVKDYGHLLGHDAAFAVRARRIAALAMDVTEFLTDRLDLGAPHGWSDIRVAYHSACSLQHGQRVNTQPRQLLSTAGFTVAEIPEGHLCCGSAGAYNILQPEIASQLRARKLGHIASVKPDCIATGNIGCLNQLSGDDAPPVVHTIELIDWAYGGKCPAELTHLKGRMRLMTEMFGAKAENQAAPV